MSYSIRNILLFAAAAGALSANAITTIDIPGATSTLVTGISNNGIAVGLYYDSSNNIHGFEMLANGSLVYPLDDPNATPEPFTTTAPRGVNDSGTIVGQYGPSVGNGFTLSGATYSAYGVGGDYTHSLAINDQGDIAGTNVVAGQDEGFLVIGNNSPVFVNVPGAFATDVVGINDLDDIWGYYSVTVGNSSVQYAFFRTPDGTITTVGVESVGQIFLGVNDDGTLRSTPLFSVPGSNSTNVLAMNDSGEFVGYYTDNTGNHGFVAEAAPEPASRMLAAAGLLCLGALRRKKRVPLAADPAYRL
jgi:hypothetical protein